MVPEIISIRIVPDNGRLKSLSTPLNISTSEGEDVVGSASVSDEYALECVGLQSVKTTKYLGSVVYVGTN